RLMDVDQPLVGPDLEVLARVLVLEGRADHAVDVLLRRQRNGTGHGRAGAGSRLDDLLRGHLDRGVVVGLEADADLVLGQGGHNSVLNVSLDLSWARTQGQAAKAARPAARQVVSVLLLLDDFGNDAGAHRATALADRESQARV